MPTTVPDGVLLGSKSGSRPVEYDRLALTGGAALAASKVPELAGRVPSRSRQGRRPLSRAELIPECHAGP